VIERAMLASRLLLLKGSSPGFDQGILDAASDFDWKHWSWVQGSWHRFLPGLQHFIELLASLSVHKGVGIHKGLVEVAAQVNGIWRPYIFDHRIHYI
jgi:hypothetical protein